MKTIIFIYIVCITWVMILGFLMPPYFYNDYLPPHALSLDSAQDWVTRVFFWLYYLCDENMAKQSLIIINTGTAAMWGAALAKSITLIAARRNRVYRTQREQQTISY